MTGTASGYGSAYGSYGVYYGAYGNYGKYNIYRYTHAAVVLWSVVWPPPSWSLGLFLKQAFVLFAMYFGCSNDYSSDT